MAAFRSCLLLLLFCNTAMAQIAPAIRPDSVTIGASRPAAVKTTITFPSLDGLTITADQYFVSDTLPWMVLCHQAGYSRGEYEESAPKFAKLGYNCLAIDQRSGGAVNNVINQTAALAKQQHRDDDYLDAEQDIRAALKYAHGKNGKPVVLVGSSYSASLVLKIAAGNPDVKAVIAFSPGEYFGKKLKLASAITGLTCPVFLCSTQEEAPAVKALAAVIPAATKVQFIPSSAGRHGSKALWVENESRTDYWIALLQFMNNL